MKHQITCFLATLGLALAAPNWKKCPTSDPNVTDCLKEAIEAAVKDLTHARDLGFEDMEPVHYGKKIPILDTATGPFRGKLIYDDISVDGLTKAQVKKVEKVGPGVLRIEFWFPETNIHGKYLMDTVLLAVPMKGNGDFKLDIKDLTINFEFTIKEKDGFYEAVDIKQPSFDVKFLQIHHTNLFNGNKALGDNVNKILNEQWRTLAKELGPIAVRAFSPVYKKITNQVLNKIPAKEYPLPL